MNFDARNRLVPLSLHGARRKVIAGISVAAMTVGVGAVATLSAQATGISVQCADGTGTPPAWTTVKKYDASNNLLKQSNFEVDASANLDQDGSSPCIDWNSTSVSSTNPETPDLASGSGDDSFGQGTSENDATPTVVSGSIPPNKSDLTNFGVYAENPSTGGHYVALNWARANNPSGTTNMDFELNQKFCDWDATNGQDNTGSHCSGNHVTPQRSLGDILITYDLAKGGTHPTISYRTWTMTGWGAATALNSNQAAGSVNTSAIAADANSLLPVGQDAYTFGEAVFDLDSVLSGCGSFGSIYLKSRSSTSFTSEIKDFIPPKQVQITNCPSSLTTAQSFLPNDSATVTGGTSGTVTFTLFGPANTTCAITGATPVVGTDHVVYTETVNLSNTGHAATTNAATTVTTAGTYRWLVSYSGGGIYASSSTACGAEQFTFANS